MTGSGRAFRIKRWSRVTAVVIAAIMLASSQDAVAAPTGWHGLGWDLPALQAERSVKGSDVKALSGNAPSKTASAPVPAVHWPAAGKAQVDLPATAQGGASPKKLAVGNQVSVTRGHGRDSRTGAYSATAASSPQKHDAARVEVSTVDHAVADKAGIRGTLVQVAPVSGDTSGPVEVVLDYRSFAGAYGADFGRRLRFVQYPSCVVSTPEKPECRTGTPVASANDAKAGQLAGEVALAPTATVLAATPDTSSGDGDFKVTKLSPAGSWTAGEPSGEFNYSYPLSAPAGPGGPAPSVSLQYSSGAVDGLTSATNNQASEIGDGWSVSGGGYVERSYKSCSEDLGGNNGQTKTGDLCWATDNARLSLAGRTTELVKDTATGAWRLRTDDGSRVEKVTGASNGAQGGEHWKITTVDGTQYFFGLNHLPGWQAGNPETQSTWTEPVFGNNPGEPCNAATFAASWCQQAWRWNLDYVVDPRGNAMTFYYQPETNYYGLNLNTTSPGTPYVRGGYLQRIEYGFNTRVAGVFTHAPAQIVFDTTERCLPGGAVTCDPAQLTTANAASWPDVPADQLCAQGANCTNVSPAFFSRRRITAISTQVTDAGTGWKTANQWTLAQSFPASGDGSSPAMWLDSITQTGKAGGSISLPPVSFHPKALANRVDASNNYTALTRNRIDAVTNEEGGVTAVKYADPQCVPGKTMPANPETNTLACYPTYWTPGGATEPVLDWFNKYLVTDVTEDGRTTLSQQTLTHYDYVGGGAWHYDENYLADPKNRTWSLWRGYAAVKTTVGQATSDPSGPPAVTQTLYLRGMDGDTLPGGGKRSVSMTDSLGETIPDSKPVPGFTRESQTYLDGKVIATTINDPWISAPTATNGDGTQAFYTGTGTTRTRTWIAAANNWRTTRTSTTFGNYGLATQVEKDGDIADPNQATCTRSTYSQNTTAWLINYVNQVQTTAGTCATPASSATIVSDTRSYFDHQPFGAVPTAGNVTQTDTVDSWPADNAEHFLSPATRTDFDNYGRTVSATDALGLTTTTAFTPSTGGPVTQVVTTTPQVSSTDTTKFTSIRYLDPITGALTAAVDHSGLRTDAAYDALGRLTAVWPPGHSKSANAPAKTTYAYTVSNTGPSVVATNTLLSSSKYATSYALVDGLGRTVQTQAPTSYSQGGRVVTDSYYGSHGQVWKTHDAYWNGDSGPVGTLLTVTDNTVPSTTVSTFDSAGRATGSAYQLYGVEQWRGTTVYDGDRTTAIPPLGGTASSVVTNGLGQKVQLAQYKDPAHTNPGDPADVTSYTYTHDGLLASTTDSTGHNTWKTSYDLLGRKTSATDPDTGLSQYTYDNGGRMLTSADASGRTLAYTYDNLGRKTAEYQASTSGTKLAAWTYDTVLKDKPTASSRYAGGKTYTNTVEEYDKAGRVAYSHFTVPLGETGFGGNYSFSWRYDPLSDVLRSFGSPAVGGLPDESMITGYDALDQPVTYQDAGDGGTLLVSETDYNPYGQVLRTNYQDPTLPDQIAVTHTYADGTNRLATTLAERATKTNFMIANRFYGYDPAGNITSLADTPQDAQSDTQCFSYDYLQRLTQAFTPAAGNCATTPSATGLGGAAPYWTSWTYDTTGNRLTQTQHGAAGDTTSKSTYPNAGQPQPHAIQALDTTGPNGSSHSAYTYDPSGRTLTQGPAGAGQTFTYDAEGHIATATDASGKVSSYTYDADGNLLLTKDPTGTTLKLNDLELFRGTGTSQTVGTRFYTFNGAPVAERDANAGLTWSMTDTQNTAYATVKADTLAVTQRWQDPYGVSRGPAPSLWPDKHGYLGGYRNTTGLTHLGAREYDPALGRFTTVDPVLKTDDPQQMNGYSYANDNPVGLTDPSGLCPGVPDGACRMPDGRIGGGDACRNGGWSCDKPTNNTCGCRAAQQHPANHGAPASSGGHRKAAPKQHGASGGGGSGGSDDGDDGEDFWGWLGGHLKKAGEAVYEFSGAKDLVDGCFRDPAVVGCIKGVLEVGAWFVPGGAAARGTELAVSGGAHLIEGEVGAESRAVAEDLAAGCNSFAGSTSVLMADGTMKPIEQVKVGDKVRNAEPDNASTEIHAVTALHITDTDRDFVDVTVATPGGPKKITSTAHHRWWDATTHTWTDATNLRPGDLLDTPGNGHAAVQTLNRYTTSIRTYNLTIDTTHTYYVLAGTTPVLVHNCGGWTSEGNLDRHFDKHGHEMGIDTKSEYDYAARDLTCTCGGRRPGVQIKQDGAKTYYFDPHTSEFAVTGNEGIMSYYHADQAYFGRQPGMLVP
ncbi:intein C-terminal splicing region/RHS repeat-associated core domain-containing protein [Amycolatopsis rubida]|uniref:Intein C-terminal splicing region/RHS repeat-associated core domain-containing protein n=1 Tax=Amycolatopsis rubida TaxID=112413 RepID=A0A1I5E614_9PSEU|nr:intein C-terminal splicing region/RHS repeat-associated core domain-containing protein [Amycolatopsis rubida]